MRTKINILVSAMLLLSIITFSIGENQIAYATNVKVPYGDSCPKNTQEVPEDPSNPIDPANPPTETECEPVTPAQCPTGQKNVDDDITKCESIIVGETVEEYFFITDVWQCKPDGSGWDFLAKTSITRAEIPTEGYLTIDYIGNRFDSVTGEDLSGRCNAGWKDNGKSEKWISTYEVTYAMDKPPTPPYETDEERLRAEFEKLPSNTGGAYVLPPTPVVPAPTFPSWFTELEESIKQREQDYVNNDGKQSKALFDLGDSTSIETLLTNIPVNGNLNLTGKEFFPELAVKNKNDVFQFPMMKAEGSVTQDSIDKLWNKYTSGGVTTDIFVYEVKDPSSLPENVELMFTRPRAEYKYYNTITNSSIDMSGFKIDKSGYYVVGSKVKVGSVESIDVRGLKVVFNNDYGWLPVKNDLISQVNEHMVVTSWTKGDHDMGNLLYESYKSLKIPSSYNHEFEVISVGSPKGIKGLKLFNMDLKPRDITTTLTDSSKIIDIIEYDKGFLVSTSNVGMHYVDLNENVSFKISGLTSDSINSIFLDKDNIYIANNLGISTGEIKIKRDSTTGKVLGVEFTKSKEILNSAIFDSSNEVGSIEVALNKIVVTPKNNSGSSNIAIIDKF